MIEPPENDNLAIREIWRFGDYWDQREGYLYSLLIYLLLCTLKYIWGIFFSFFFLIGEIVSDGKPLYTFFFVTSGDLWQLE